MYNFTWFKNNLLKAKQIARYEGFGELLRRIKLKLLQRHNQISANNIYHDLYATKETITLNNKESAINIDNDNVDTVYEKGLLLINNFNLFKINRIKDEQPLLHNKMITVVSFISSDSEGTNLVDSINKQDYQCWSLHILVQPKQIVSKEIEDLFNLNNINYYMCVNYEDYLDALNMIISKSRGQYICYLDGGSHFPQDLFSAFLSIFEKDDQISAIHCLDNSFNGNIYFHKL